MLPLVEMKGCFLLTVVPSLLILLVQSCLAIVQCPPLPPGNRHCNHSCTDDSSCPPHKMCCYSGSCRLCVDPIDMPPTCENTKLACSGNQKCFLQIEECAQGPCFPKPVCADEDQVSCQPVPLLVEGFPMDLCTDDSMCPLGRKCCSNGNGHDCQAVWVELPPRQSPHPITADFTDCETINCEYGKICVMIQKNCEDHPCAPPLPQCLAPWSSSCPSEILQGACDMMTDQCSMTADDTSCRRGTNCCNIGCGNVCMKPVLELPGYCPESSSTDDEHGHCMQDTDCRKGYKCCRNRCSAMLAVMPGTSKMNNRKTNRTTTTVVMTTDTSTMATTSALQESHKILLPPCPNGPAKIDSNGKVLSCGPNDLCPFGSYCQNNGGQTVCCPHPLKPVDEAVNGINKNISSFSIICLILLIFAVG